MSHEDRHIVVLCSGGMDSVTVLSLVFRLVGKLHTHCLFIDYGQSALREERIASWEAARKLGISFKEVSINLREQGVLNSTIMRDVKEKDIDTLKTYVPARNMLLIAIACAYAISIGATKVAIGVHYDDDPLAYPDCKPPFINPMQAACEQYGIKLDAPFLDQTKKQIIQKGMKLGVDYDTTSSCYWPVDGKACGECPSCKIRIKSFDAYDRDRSKQTSEEDSP